MERRQRWHSQDLFLGICTNRFVDIFSSPSAKTSCASDSCIDVWAAFIINQTTLIPTNSWVTDDSLELAAAKNDIDDYCNLAILMFARIINLLNTHRRMSAMPSSFSDAVEQAWTELQRWRLLRPDRVKPFLRDDTSNERTFPTIVFSHSASSE